MRAAAVMGLREDGARGYFYPVPGADRAVIVLLGDDGKDFLSQACARWLTRVQGISALCLALREPGEDSGIRGWPLERVEAAVHWLRGRGIGKVGIFGMSMQAVLALSAASRLPELSLTLALTPCDFVPWGFVHGRLGRARNAEWPSGGSLLSWRGQELAFQPAGLEREAYWQLFDTESRRCHEMRSRGVFDRSEALHPIEEAAFIPVEKLSGPLVLVGAEDDSMWDSCRYIRRMAERLGEKGFDRPMEVLTWPFGTHLLLPERMLTGALPLVDGLVSRMFDSGRKHPKECRQARRELEERLTDILKKW